MKYFLCIALGVVIGMCIIARTAVSRGTGSIHWFNRAANLTHYTRYNGVWVPDEYLDKYKAIIDTAIKNGWPPEKIKVH